VNVFNKGDGNLVPQVSVERCSLSLVGSWLQMAKRLAAVKIRETLPLQTDLSHVRDMECLSNSVGRELLRTPEKT
jgi:hypothetical protein